MYVGAFLMCLLLLTTFSVCKFVLNVCITKMDSEDANRRFEALLHEKDMQLKSLREEMTSVITLKDERYRRLQEDMAAQAQQSNVEKTSIIERYVRSFLYLCSF